MSRRIQWTGITCLFLSVSGSLPATAQEMLTWKFTTDDVFFVEEVVIQKQSVTIADRTDTKETKQTTITRYQVLDVSPNGDVDLEITIDSIIDEGGQPTAIARRIAGSKFGMTLGADGKLSRFDGYASFVKRVANGNVQFERLFQSVLNEDTLRQTMVQLLTAVPRKSVQRGQSWQQKQSLNVGPFGTLNVDRTFEHKGVADRDGISVVDLELRGVAEYQLPDPNTSRLPFKISQGSLQVDQFRGTGTYDLARQRLNQLSVTLHVSGSLTISVGPQKAELTIDQSQSSTLRVLDKSPRGR